MGLKTGIFIEFKVHIPSVVGLFKLPVCIVHVLKNIGLKFYSSFFYLERGKYSKLKRKMQRIGRLRVVSVQKQFNSFCVSLE
jgi:hypothetical protein